MTWARLDDGFHDDPKIIGVDLAAVGLFAVSLTHAGRQLTDGKLSRAVAQHLSRGNHELIAQLVAANLWEEQPDGYVIRNYLRFNPKAKDVKRKRKEAKDRMRSLRSRSREQRENKSECAREQSNTGCLGDGSGRDSTALKPASSRNARAIPTADPIGFLDFWAAYPRKEGKGDARKAWLKLQPDAVTTAAIATALQWQCVSPRWLEDGGRYVPHPATYLNARRWEDEPPTAARMGNAGAKSLPGLQRFAAKEVPDATERSSAVR